MKRTVVYLVGMIFACMMAIGSVALAADEPNSEEMVQQSQESVMETEQNETGDVEAAPAEQEQDMQAPAEESEEEGTQEEDK